MFPIVISEGENWSLGERAPDDWNWCQRQVLHRGLRQGRQVGDGGVTTREEGHAAEDVVTAGGGEAVHRAGERAAQAAEDA